MKKFIEAYRGFKTMKKYGQYRLCWIPLPKGSGIYSVIEFYDEELKLLDKNKVIVIC